MKIIISGGGTGGHIFPAVSIANAVKALDPDPKSSSWALWAEWRCSACLLPATTSSACP